jgi:hypothetical protein
MSMTSAQLLAEVRDAVRHSNVTITSGAHIAVDDNEVGERFGQRKATPRRKWPFTHVPKAFLTIGVGAARCRRQPRGHEQYRHIASSGFCDASPNFC